MEFVNPFEPTNCFCCNKHKICSLLKISTEGTRIRICAECLSALPGLINEHNAELKQWFEKTA